MCLPCRNLGRLRLGSARASRAGDRALAITRFFPGFRRGRRNLHARAGALPGIVLLTLLGLTSAYAQDDCCAPKEETLTDPAPPNKRILRVTCDPNNLPFSNERREGFENKIAEL